MSHPALDLARRALLLGAVAAAGILALDACADAPTAPSPDVRASKGGTGGKPGTQETVLFTGSVGTNMDIYAMSPDGSNVRRLTTDPAEEMEASFTPDNRKIVYVRYSPDYLYADLWTANADGSKQTQLTHLGSAQSPRYSPDGTKIAFTSSSTDGALDIYTINADGTGLHRLTYESSNERSPAWSPDGQKIAFASDRDGYPKVYVMNSDGLNVQLFTTACNAPGCAEPVFNPAGDRIAFDDLSERRIWVVGVDHNFSSPVGPIPNSGDSVHPTFSKDGSQVLFASSRGIEGTFEIYAGDVGSTAVRRLTVFAPGDAQSPSYSH